MKTLDQMGELRSALAAGDMSGLDLSGMPESVVRQYLARVPVNVLATGAKWAIDPYHDDAWVVFGGSRRLELCGLPWLDSLDTDDILRWSIQYKRQAHFTYGEGPDKGAVLELLVGWGQWQRSEITDADISHMADRFRIAREAHLLTGHS